MQDTSPANAHIKENNAEDFLSFCETIGQKAQEKGLDKAMLAELLDKTPDSAS